MILRSTLEEENILESIPSDIKELIENETIDSLESEYEDKISNLESEVTKLQDERNKLTDACIQMAMEKYISGLGKVQRRKFTLSAYELSCFCDALDSSYISFNSRKFHTFNDVTYLLDEENDGMFTFVKND